MDSVGNQTNKYIFSTYIFIFYSEPRGKKFSDQPAKYHHSERMNLKEQCTKTTQPPNSTATKNPKEKEEKKNAKFNGNSVIEIHTFMGHRFRTSIRKVKNRCQSCVLERHLHWPTRGPLSKNISNPTLFADIPNKYLQSKNKHPR